MKLRDVPLRELRAMLRNTERAAGPDSISAELIRREIGRRRQLTRKRKGVRRVN